LVGRREMMKCNISSRRHIVGTHNLKIECIICWNTVWRKEELN
jgi:hypothetical protein